MDSYKFRTCARWKLSAMTKTRVDWLIVVKQYGIKEDIVEESKKTALKRLICLESKSEWIETTNKPYKEVKVVKDEIEKDEELVAAMVANIINNSRITY